MTPATRVITAADVVGVLREYGASSEPRIRTRLELRGLAFTAEHVHEVLEHLVADGIATSESVRRSAFNNRGRSIRLFRLAE
ncbi:MAG: hypothetical protein ACREN2_02180 [Candidatus Dormibacteria bacterium]